MPWQAGTYSKGNNGTGGWVGDASLGIGIEAGRHDTQDNDFATGINQCLNKDGSNSATGNLNLGGFKYTNAAAATARTELARVDQIQDGDFIWLGTTGGTATAQTANASPAITAYKAGQKFRMITGFASTGISSTTVHTLNINGAGAKNIVNQDGTNLTRGSFIANVILEVVYNGTNFVITNDPSGWQTFSTTLTPGAGSATGISYNNILYLKRQKTMFVKFDINWTQTTASCTFVDIILPVTPDSFGSVLLNSDLGQTGRAYVQSTVGAGTIRVALYNNGNILTGSQFVIVEGNYISI